MALLPTLALLCAQGNAVSGTTAPFDDHAHTMQLLGVRSIRRGPDPNDPATYDEAKANLPLSTLPDVLTMRSGAKVTRAAQWPARRRELVELFEREVYGRIPKGVPAVRWEVTGIAPGQSGAVPTITKTLVGHVEDRAYPALKVDIQASFTVPVGARAVPMMIEFGGFPGRPGAGTPWTDQAIAHGWGYGTINPNSIQPDSPRLDLGIIGLVNRGQPRSPEQWGALRAWAWGFGRLIDYFERAKDAGVDARKVGIEGVSRYGKAALVAQAFDPRVAVAHVGSSGEGGTKLHRRYFGEQIENLAGGEFYWMAGNLIKYGADDPRRTAEDLPVDSHELIALCAPRACFISHGVPEKGDALWIDARGSWMAGILAEPVYRLLGRSGFGRGVDFRTEPLPPVGTLVGGDLAWRQHEGGHEVAPNWPAFFDWVGGHVTAPPLPQGAKPYVAPADVPSPRGDANSRAAHLQMVQKARTGRIDLYFLGDSITRRWGTSDAAYAPFLANWTENFHGWNAGDFGWGGDSTQNVHWRIKNGELEGVNPKAIVLLAGTNNVGSGPFPASGPDAAKVADVTRGVRAILDECRRKAPRATIVLTAIFPRAESGSWATIAAINRNLARLADGRRVRFLDVNAHLVDAAGKPKEGVTVDGLHLSLAGYGIWADGLRPILTDLLGPRAETDLAPPPTGDPSATAPKPSG